MGPVIDRILYQDHRDEVFKDKEGTWLSEFSNVEVWEVGRTTSRHQQMNDSDFLGYLKVSAPASSVYALAKMGPRTRISLHPRRSCSAPCALYGHICVLS